jgi:hypothetical protein
MKTNFILILAGLLGAGPLEAGSPAQRTTVEERFFGSNPRGYAILRSETEPDGDGNTTRCKTWLDEYAKTPVVLYNLPEEEGRIRNGAYTSNLVSSTLLFDISSGQPPHDNVDSQPPHPAATAHILETAITMSTVLLRYPTRSLTPWSPEKMRDLRSDDSSLFIHYKKQTLVSGQAIRTRMGGLNKGDAEVLQALGRRTIDSIAEDGNCAFLTITAATDERKQTRVFCMVPILTDNLHALASRESLYLSVGRFNTRDEALRNAHSLREKIVNKPEFSGVGIEVWAHDSTAYSRTFYYVVVNHTMDIIRQRRVSVLERLLEMPLFVVPSDSFSVLIKEPPGQENK